MFDKTSSMRQDKFDLESRGKRYRVSYIPAHWSNTFKFIVSDSPSPVAPYFFQVYTSYDFQNNNVLHRRLTFIQGHQRRPMLWMQVSDPVSFVPSSYRLFLVVDPISYTGLGRTFRAQHTGMYIIAITIRLLYLLTASFPSIKFVWSVKGIYVLPFTFVWLETQFDSNGSSGGCRETYTVIANTTVTTPTCQNVTAPSELSVSGTVPLGQLSKHSYIDQASTPICFFLLPN